MQTTHPTVEIEVIASTLRRLDRDLREVLDSIEKRDMSAAQVRDHLRWIAEDIRKIRA